MPDWMARFLQVFVPRFVAIDPVGFASIFLGWGKTWCLGLKPEFNMAVTGHTGDNCLSYLPMHYVYLIQSVASARRK